MRKRKMANVALKNFKVIAEFCILSTHLDERCFRAASAFANEIKVERATKKQINAKMRFFAVVEFAYSNLQRAKLALCSNRAENERAHINARRAVCCGPTTRKRGENLRVNKMKRLSSRIVNPNAKAKMQKTRIVELIARRLVAAALVCVTIENGDNENVEKTLRLDDREQKTRERRQKAVRVLRRRIKRETANVGDKYEIRRSIALHKPPPPPLTC